MLRRNSTRCVIPDLGVLGSPPTRYMAFHRYLPHSEKDLDAMLKTIGKDSVRELVCTQIPEDLVTRCEYTIDLPEEGKPEQDVATEMRELADQTVNAQKIPCFMGAGAYNHFAPAVQKHIVQRSEFLTSYTPYQPEVSQGTLQAIFEFQTQISMLTGMDVANASMYDGATGTTEAVLMALRLNKKKKRILISGALHPHYRDTIETYVKCGSTGATIDILDPDVRGAENIQQHISKEHSCVVVQNPDVFGRVRDFTNLSKKCKENGVLLVVAIAEPLSLGLVKNAGEMGADIVAGDCQSFALPVGFGGPHVGFFATNTKFIRQMPGRLVGATVTSDGERGFVLTLGTREQHIRREKATSNICSNSGLAALSCSIRLTMLGEKGLRSLALVNHMQACKLRDKLQNNKRVRVLSENFFNELLVELPKEIDAERFIDDIYESEGILCGVAVKRLFPNENRNLLLVCTTEMNTDDQLERLSSCFEKL